ncbi:hypothetical protein CEXT_737881 [Caerostris extrusa]|uniref:Secreted protein n=1 Tax=Caerostris extrusa TaxID=172846 RepID=A0AAV4XYM3_CAEEX|nr:hypothetical protein CEXT_737881 [Caerostris extrusa]
MPCFESFWSCALVMMMTNRHDTTLWSFLEKLVIFEGPRMSLRRMVEIILVPLTQPSKHSFSLDSPCMERQFKTTAPLYDFTLQRRFIIL